MWRIQLLLIICNIDLLLHSSTSSWSCFASAWREARSWLAGGQAEFWTQWKGASFDPEWSSRPSITPSELTAIQQNRWNSCQQSKGLSLTECSSGLSLEKGVPMCQQDRLPPPTFSSFGFHFVFDQIHMTEEDHVI